MSTNLKKLPQLYEKAPPIPDQNNTITALYNVMHKTRRPFEKSIAIVFVGLFAIIFFAFSDLLGTHPLANYLPWAVLVFAVLASYLLMAGKTKQTDELVRQLKACYADYTNNPIHKHYHNQIGFYHTCLREWNSICFEHEHLIEVTKMYYNEDRWDDHAALFEPREESGKSLKSLGGEKLYMEKFDFYRKYYGQPLRLSQLYKDHLSFEDTCHFFKVHKQYIASFDHQFDEGYFIETLINLKDVLAEEENELLKDINDCFAYLIEITAERQAAYLKFKRRYLALTQKIGANQAPFN